MQIRIMMMSTKILNRDTFSHTKGNNKKIFSILLLRHKKKVVCLMIIIEMLLIKMDYSYLLSAHTLINFFMFAINNQFHNNCVMQKILSLHFILIKVKFKAYHMLRAYLNLKCTTCVLGNINKNDSGLFNKNADY